MTKLSFVNFHSVEKWHIDQYLRETLKGRYPMVPLSKILMPIRERVSSSEYSKEIPLVDKIRFSDGQIFFKKGKLPKNDVFIAYRGFLLVSNINFEKGAFCIVQEEKIACSTDYQPYQLIFDDILPEYLNLCLRTEKFLRNVARSKPKGMKVRARWDFIKTFSIPLPSLDEQRQIIDSYYSKIQIANNLVQTSWERIDNYFIQELAARNYIYNPLVTFSFGFVNFKKLSRWDSWASDTGVSSDKYEIVPFGNLISKRPQYGANVKGVDIPSEYRYIRITDINDDGSLNETIKYPEKAEEEYILNENDFLIARSGNTVGKTFLYKADVGKAIYAGYLVRYILNQSLVYPEYLLYYTKTTIFKNWIAKNQRIAGQPNINGQEYLAFPVILPPLDVQKQMVIQVNKIFTQIKQEQEQACDLFITSKREFESALFGE